MTDRVDRQDSTARRGNRGQHHQDLTVSTGEPGQDDRDVNQLWQLGWDILDSTARTGEYGQIRLTGQPGHVSMDRTCWT
jgi:hypothetical protein